MNPLSNTLIWPFSVTCFSKNKAKRWVTFPKCGVPLDYCLILGPLFWEPPPPPWGFTIHIKHCGGGGISLCI
jgi:hypothetical protein